MAKRKPTSRKTRRRAPRRSRTDYDSFWKEALDRYFEQFLAFFYPRAHAEIDWSRGYEMLDKELQPIVRRAKRGRRYVDKLVKIWLKTGHEHWILIHVEVQATKENEFPRRVVLYNHRLFDRYDREVISLAILADDDPHWRPNQFGYSRWDFRTVTEFPIVKLLDYAPRWQELESNPNPFATVVLAHLKTLETQRSASDRYAWKVRLVKGLYQRGLDAEEVRQLYRLLDWILELPEDHDERFWDEITTYEQEQAMPFVTTGERVGRKKGLEEGEKLGLEKGKKQGREEGLLEGIESCLRIKFGDAGLELMPDIREIHNHELLSRILSAIETAASPKDLRPLVEQPRRRPEKGKRS